MMDYVLKPRDIGTYLQIGETSDSMLSHVYLDGVLLSSAADMKWSENA